MWLAKCVIPECNVDSCLFNVLLHFGKDGVNHTKGNATVVKKVKEKFDNLFCVAIIDKDRRDIDFITNECVRIELEGVNDYFRFFKRNEKPHYFIQVVPAIEQWIMKVCEELGIDLAETSVAVLTIEELKKVSKSTLSKHDERFVSLFKEILKRAEELNYLPLLKMQRIIKYLLEKQYNADINEIQNV